MIIETKVYEGNQTTIPSEFRKKHNIKPNDIVEWNEDANGNITVSFRKKVTLNDIIGIGKTKERTNAVKLKKDLYR
ncbi:AbrB/MazE/SpoVT family DNA-binding domain-containing protein [Methanobrevibacter sp.]|uniref:AbrB/MazE/SpoVT family DNA-binding domain-containing protein n=1 Tax=Methanobrevibacter sp. TaxID=66852 RepID=UPI00261F6063|nr:AbrB/MazE/SpoVT family DNA-binding domain-containing protein [uncultured Methanobrevibacter sp.]